MTSVDLTTRLGPLTLKNPLLAASGTFGFGEEYAHYVDLSCFGAIVVKGATLHPRDGNPPPRVIETPAGMLNAIGLQNPGIDAIIAHKLPFLAQFDTAVILNISGESIEEYVEMARRSDGVAGVAALELNVSCPNVARGGMQFGLDPRLVHDLVAAVRAATTLPLITKLSPNVTDIRGTARAAAEAGSDILSLINTLLGMSIDVARRRPALSNVTGGLSGPAIRPVAVRMVWQVARELPTPLIGMGGIMTARDALEFILAGASAIAVGTANFVFPEAGPRVLDGIVHYCQESGVSSLTELVGAAQRT